MIDYRLKRVFTYVFRIFRIRDNKVFFSSYEGKQISCNPKYIFLEMISSKKNYEIVWEFNSKEFPEDLKKGEVKKVVRHNSLGYFYHLLTSKYIFTNSGITASIALRTPQICVNTWHGGGAYKKVGAIIDEKVNGTSKKALEVIAGQTTFFISSSKVFTEVMIPSTLIEKKKFLEIGMPRNDIFFNETLCRKTSVKVKKYYNLDSSKKVVLYAPTYRGKVGNVTEFNVSPDVDLVINALKSKFGGEWVFFYRDHYYKHSNKKIDDCIDAYDYPDMQELLCTADILITDYSSCIWDYSLTFKPCFLYVPDLKEYASERGGFYTNIEQWPGIIAENNMDIDEKIRNFDRKIYLDKIRKSHEYFGSFENGNATRLLLDKLKVN